MWDIVFAKGIMEDGKSLHFMDWLERILLSHLRHAVELFLVIAWAIWSNKNSFLHKGCADGKKLVSQCSFTSTLQSSNRPI